MRLRRGTVPRNRRTPRTSVLGFLVESIADPTGVRGVVLTVGVEGDDPLASRLAREADVHGGAQRGSLAEVDRVLAKDDVREPRDTARQRMQRVAAAVVHDHMAARALRDAAPDRCRLPKAPTAPLPL